MLRVVVFSGSGLLKPQSPTIRDVEGVVTERCVGKLAVAELLWCFVAVVKLPGGPGIGVGIENIRDDLRSAAPGDTVAPDIAAIEARGGAQWCVYYPRSGQERRFVNLLKPGISWRFSGGA